MGGEIWVTWIFVASWHAISWVRSVTLTFGVAYCVIASVSVVVRPWSWKKRRSGDSFVSYNMNL